MNSWTGVAAEQVIQAVREAGACLTDPAAVHSIRAKGETDYVTNVDLAVQELLRERLAVLTPDIQFMGEEQDNSRLDWHRPCWILDPVDGTTNLIHDCHQSCVALALWDGEKLVFGCCYNPFREETFVAELGKGAYLNGQPIHVSDMSEMEKALVIVGTSPYEREKTDRVFDMVKRIFQRSADIRRLGSAELDLCWVACGRADCYVEYNLKPWDYAAGSVILHEAGGKLSDCAGQDPKLPFNSDICCSNGLLQAEFLDIVQDPA